MKKKIIASLLCATMVVGLVACGGGNSGSGSASTDTGSSTSSSSSSSSDSSSSADSGDTAAAADIDTSEHVVISYMTTGDAPSGESKEELDKAMAELNAILTEKVNAELEIYFISWTDYLANYNRTLASMDGSVDLVGTATDWLDAWPNAKNGAFLELSEDMLKTYAPKTWESVSQEHWDLCKYNGDIYLMPEDNYAQWTNHGYIYRLDWAKEAGLSNGCHSWEDMTKYWAYVKEAYPDITPWDSDGTHNVQMASGWVASHTNFVPIDGICTAALWGGTKDDLYTIVTPAYTDTDMMVEFAKMMKEWDEIGVWKTDVLNNTASTNRDDFRVGRSGADQHHTQTWTGLCAHTSNNEIFTTDDDCEVGFFYFGEETGNLVSLNITHGAMAVSAASKNPERALMVYDLIRNDPDCYHLFCYGIQGVSWDVNDEGLRIQPEGYNSDTQNIGGMTNYWWGRNDDLEIRDSNMDWPTIDALYAEYDKIKIDYPYGQFIPDMDSIQGKVNNVNEQFGNYMKQIAYGKYSGSAEDIVAEMQAALKQAGIEDVTAELQAQIDALYK